jgi:ATP/maltotriose-dependent transcriptional regulator MalT/DNA-binding SARP family transcriptional activator
MSRQPVALAKTTRPSIAGVFARERLFARLDRARASRVIWITGPPGSGKTTLAASYLERRKLRSIWYQLDEGDGDVASFFYYLELAAAEHLKKKSERLPKLTPEYQAGAAAFARRYAQALFQHLGRGFALVFDGYHEVPAQSPLHELMREALAEVPADGCVIVTSRGDPPPAMARLRVSQALEVIGWNELRLTREESDALVAERGRKLAGATLAELHERTQGWPAGVVLLLARPPGEAALDASADLAAPQLVFDYLAGEMLDKADARIRELLLSTAYLPKMTGAMAGALTGRDDAGATLAEIHRNNYFTTITQASPAPVYQCHPLLREFLLSRARETLSKEARLALQRRSAELLEAEGSLAEAAALLRAIDDWDRLVGLIARHAAAMVDRGMGETLARWVDALPQDVLRTHPWTLYWLAVARTPVSPREGRLLFEQAFELFGRQPGADVEGSALACSGAMDAILYELDDFSLLDRWIAVMSRLLADHRELASGPLEARLASSLFASMVLRQPHHPDLVAWVERAYRASRAHPDAGVRMSVEPRVAISILWAGHYPKAWEVIEGMRRLVQSREVSPFARTMLKLVEAMYFMHLAQSAPCLKAVQEGLEIERAAGASVHTAQLLLYGAGGALMAGDPDAAEGFLGEIAALPRGMARFDQCLFHLFSTWHALARQDALRAYQQQKLALTMAREVGCPYFEALCHVASAHVLYASGEERNGFSHFRRLYEIARRIDNSLLEFTGLIGFASVVLERGRRPRAGSWALRRALEIGKPRSFTAFVLWRPEPLARLCSHALEAGIEPNYVAEIIRARGLKFDAARSALADWPWPFRVRTLGGFRLLKGDAEVTFTGKGQRRPLALLKALIASGGRQVGEERLTEALWPRIDGDSAHRSFTITLHRLRKLLGEDRALVLAEGKLTLDGRYVWVDTWAFEQATARIDEWLRGRKEHVEPERLAAAADRLLALYAGPFLANETDASWGLALRERLRNRFVRVVGELGRFWREAGEAERALAFYERALEADDLSESVYRHLMLCYSELGRRAEAADVYGRCRTTLVARLGVEPSPETRAIYDRVIAAT